MPTTKVFSFDAVFLTLFTLSGKFITVFHDNMYNTYFDRKKPLFKSVKTSFALNLQERLLEILIHKQIMTNNLKPK